MLNTQFFVCHKFIYFLSHHNTHASIYALNTSVFMYATDVHHKKNDNEEEKEDKIYLMLLLHNHVFISQGKDHSLVYLFLIPCI
jgi:hypothetical protein